MSISQKETAAPRCGGPGSSIPA